MSTTISSNIDVLVVGAGPAGLTTALGLAKAGIKVRIIDIKAQGVALGHADGVMPRTVEILQSYGVGDDLLRKGHRAYFFCNYNYDPATAGIKFSSKLQGINEPTAQHKCCILHHQGFIESLLLSGLLQAGVKVERACKPVKMALSEDESEFDNPKAYPVKLVLEHAAAAPGTPSTEAVRAKFVVGADGAHSWVRRTLDIAMEGDSTSRVWGAIDFTPLPSSTFPDWRNIATVNARDAGLMLIPREDGKVRLYIELGTEDALPRDARGRPDTSGLSPAALLDIARGVFKPYTLETRPEDVEWWTAYIVGQRVAARFAEKRRVFIVGDACHTHSPKGGQGMNVSISDGHNLAWKIAHVLKSWSPMSLLDTYEAERRPFAQELIAFDRWYAEGFSAKARAKLVADTADGAGVALPGPLEAFLSFSAITTGVGIHYAASAITSPTSSPEPGAAAPGPFALMPGKRVPPHALVRVADRRPLTLQDALPADGRARLLVFSGALTGADDAARMVSIERAVKALVDRVWKERFALVVVLARVGDATPYLDVPMGLREDWTSVLVDAVSPFSNESGGAYAALGVPASGQIVVVRPDGYVGAMAGLDEMQKLEQYLHGWMI